MKTTPEENTSPTKNEVRDHGKKSGTTSPLETGSAEFAGALFLRTPSGAPILDAQQTQQLSPGDARQRVVRLLFGCLGILQAHKLVRFEPSLDLRAAVRELTMDLLTLWGAKRPALVAGLPNANLLANRALLELL